MPVSEANGPRVPVVRASRTFGGRCEPAAQGGRGVGQEEQDETRRHRVVAAADLRVLRVVDHELDVVEARLRHRLPAAVEHAGGEVGPDDGPWADGARDLEQDGAPAAADVEPALARPRWQGPEQARGDGPEERDADVVVALGDRVEECGDLAGGLRTRLAHDR
jgi:hypothetical protein